MPSLLDLLRGLGRNRTKKATAPVYRPPAAGWFSVQDPDTVGWSHPARAVSSSNLGWIAYDVSRSTLRVKFQNGSIYDYFGVPLGAYLGLLTAPSKGSELHARFKGVYPYNRIA